MPNSKGLKDRPLRSIYEVGELLIPKLVSQGYIVNKQGLSYHRSRNGYSPQCTQHSADNCICI